MNEKMYFCLWITWKITEYGFKRLSFSFTFWTWTIICIQIQLTPQLLTLRVIDWKLKTRLVVMATYIAELGGYEKVCKCNLLTVQQKHIAMHMIWHKSNFFVSQLLTKHRPSIFQIKTLTHKTVQYSNKIISCKTVGVFGQPNVDMSLKRPDWFSFQLKWITRLNLALFI